MPVYLKYNLRLISIFSLLLVTTISHAAPVAYPSLDDSSDSLLQSELERGLGRIGLVEAARKKKLSVALVEITERTTPRVASINGNLMMYSASLPKITIMLAAYQRMEEGVLKYNQRLLKEITDMIRSSSNTAATHVLNLVGPFYLNRLLQSDKYRLYDVRQNGGLWVGKPYGKAPAYQRDPLYSLSHGASAFQVARFYYLLDTGRLVSPEASKAMKNVLSDPRIHHKFVAGLKAIHPESMIYRKSGTWQTYHSDSALIERNGRRYIAVALADDANGEEWLRRLIVEMDNIIFSHIPDIQVAG